MDDGRLEHQPDGAVTVSIPIRIRRYGGRKEVVVPQGISTDLNALAAPTALQVALARGHRWLRQIESGKVTNISAIAKAETVDRSYISRMINLTTLAPETQAAILDETLPDTVSLFDLASDTPLSWEEQRWRVLSASWPESAACRLETVFCCTGSPLTAGKRFLTYLYETGGLMWIRSWAVP